jgi:hypothetical protein
MIKPNRCPYCDCPYTIEARGCVDHCRPGERARQLLREALEDEDRRVRDLYIAGLPYREP